MKRKLNPEETEAVREKILGAISAGNVECANPQATEILASMNEPVEEGFSYLVATPLQPIRPSKKTQGYWRDGGIFFQWGKKGFGFGEATIVFRQGQVLLDDEHCGKQFVKDLLCAWVDRMKISD